MMMQRSRAFRRGLLPAVALAALLAAGCAPRAVPDVTAADIPALEAELAQAPDDAALRTRLAAAYYDAGRFDAARQMLDPVVASPDAPAAAFLYSGLASEELGDWTAAREAYAGYLALERDEPLTAEIEGRMALVVRRELHEQARSALERESELATREPEPRSLAVFPFRTSGEDESLAPLSAALTELMITDLQLSGALTLLERARVQALLDEMALAEAGYTEPGTGARVGRLLSAEHVVQGVVTSLGGESVRLDAAVLRAARQEPRGELAGQGGFEEIFDLEKELVFGVLDALGVQITAAERQRIEENRAANLTSFLAYGRGLRALDRGDYREALQHFDESARLDPSFAPAQSQRRRASGMQTASAGTPGAGARTGAEAGPAPAGDPSADEGLLLRTADELNPSPVTQLVQNSTQAPNTSQQANERNSAQEAQGTEGVTQSTTARLTLTIRRPTNGGN